MNALDALFRDEVDRQAYALRESFERCTSLAPDGEMLFAAQALKGAARVVGIKEAEHIADALESVVSTAEAARSLLSPPVLQACADALELVEAIAQAGAAQAHEVASEEAVGDLLRRFSAHAVARTATKRGRSSAAIPAATLELFRQECELNAGTLNDGLLALEKQSDQPDVIERVMRACHSIKGAARAVGLDAAVALAHAAEDQLERARRGLIVLTPDLIDALLAASDLFQRIGMAAISKGGGPTDESVFETAERISRTGLQTAVQAAGIRQPAAPPVHVQVSSSAGTPAPSPTTIAPTGAAVAQEFERTVRIRASQLSRVVALSGELLVESGQHRALSVERRRVRLKLLKIADLVDRRLLQIVKTTNDQRMLRAMEEIRLQLNDARVADVEWAESYERCVQREEDLILRLHSEAIDSRMRPVSDGLTAFPRLVRDVAKRLGKQASLTVRGESHRIDRDILERIEAPLNHLLRNALDHGLEKPVARRERGKLETGSVEIDVRVASGSMEITVSDDGGGIHLDKVRARIAAMGLADAEAVKQYGEQRLLDHLFASGFSTADQITELSGRGVGLAVVRSVMRDIGGSVSVRTQEGKGAQFQLKVPLSRSLLRAIVVSIAGEPYAFSLTQVERLARVQAHQVQVAGDRRYFVLEETACTLVSAASALELAAVDEFAQALHVVVVNSHGHRIGFVVDAVHGEQDMVLQVLDPRLGRVPNLSAAAVLPDGRPVLVIDTDDLVRSTLNRDGNDSSVKPAPIDRAGSKPPQVLVVDDSPTVRAMEQELFNAAGFEVTTAVDGMDAWGLLRQRDFDLVVTDIDMPRLDGIGLIRSIKQEMRHKKTPIIVMSYRASNEERQRGLSAGADVYMIKADFDDQTLLEAAQRLLDLHPRGP